MRRAPSLQETPTWSTPSSESAASSTSWPTCPPTRLPSTRPCNGADGRLSPCPEPAHKRAPPWRAPTLPPPPSPALSRPAWWPPQVWPRRVAGGCGCLRGWGTDRVSGMSCNLWQRAWPELGSRGYGNGCRGGGEDIGRRRRTSLVGGWDCASELGVRGSGMASLKWGKEGASRGPAQMLPRRGPTAHPPAPTPRH